MRTLPKRRGKNITALHKGGRSRVNSIYLWIGFVVVWLLIVALGLAFGWFVLVFVAFLYRNIGLRQRGGITLFGWQISTRRGFEWLLASVRHHAALHKEWPNSTQKIQREFLAGLQSRRFTYEALGFVITWVRYQPPCWPWRLERRSRYGNVTWLPKV